MANNADIKFNVDNLELFYGNFKALKGIDMEIKKNEITALIGPSGCGKSTFLKTLNRMNDLEDGVKVTGRIHLDGVDIYKEIVRMATSRMWLLLSGIIIPMMSPGRQLCLSPVICSTISLATGSLSSILIHPSENGSTISWLNIRMRTASSPRINTATGACHRRNWN